MKEYLRQLVGEATDDHARRSIVREYLQARILESLQDEGVFLRWAFVGGTALRFLYGIPRFSEDLDFSLVQVGKETGFREVVMSVKRVFDIEGYPVQLKANEERTVASAWISFPGLFHELHLSPQRSQALSIKIELDTNPPVGAGIETTVVRRHVTLNLCHHDKSSLLAGKLHAILSRPWAKGRDLFDLAWYLADRTWPTPNLEFLNAALQQTGWTGPVLTAVNWRTELSHRLDQLDWKQAQDDVRPFLERERDLALVSRETIQALI